MCGKCMDMLLRFATSGESVWMKKYGIYPKHIGHLEVMLIRYCRTIVNEAATASPVQPIINMGQGFL